MKPKNKLTSPIDSIIIDMILDHYNTQSATGRKESLSGDDFQDIVNEAKKIYFRKILIEKEPGIA